MTCPDFHILVDIVLPIVALMIGFAGAFGFGVWLISKVRL